MKISGWQTFRTGPSTILRVDTDEGLRGYGETSILPAAERALLNTKIGREASAYEVLRTELAAAPHAQAALNMALLDILGKKARVPVYQILGGATRAKVRVLTALEGDGTAQVRAGHRALVVPVPEVPFPNPRFEFVRTVVARLEALRQRLGENVDFVLDAAGALPPAEAANLAAAVEKFHVLWFDEPCALANLSAVAKIAKENVTPLGFGRTVTQMGTVQELFRQQTIDVLRLDIRTHGITQTRRLAALAETYYTAVAPFNGGGPVATAAAIQLAASLPNFFIQQIPAVLTADYASGLPAVQDGFLPLPVAPGLGLTIQDAALERYAEAV